MLVSLPTASRDISPESVFSAALRTIFVQPLCAIACINISTHSNNPSHWSRATGHMKMFHTLVGLGSIVLAATVGLPN